MEYILGEVLEDGKIQERTFECPSRMDAFHTALSLLAEDCFTATLFEGAYHEVAVFWLRDRRPPQ